MEPCIDIRDYNSTTIVIIKQPGSTRHSQTGEAIDKITMTLPEAVELWRELTLKLQQTTTDLGRRPARS